MKLINSSRTNNRLSDLQTVLPLHPDQNIIWLEHGNHGSPNSQIEIVRPDWNLSNLVYIGDEEQSYSIGSSCIVQGYLPIRDNCLDQIVVLGNVNRYEGWLFKESKRVLKSEGWLFVGLGNVHVLMRMFSFLKINTFVVPKYRKAISLVDARNQLIRNRFIIKNIFGVHGSLFRPEYLIPLEHKAYSLFFLNQLLSPYSRKGMLRRNLAMIMARLNLYKKTYKDIIIVAQSNVAEDSF